MSAVITRPGRIVFCLMLAFSTLSLAACGGDDTGKEAPDPGPSADGGGSADGGDNSGDNTNDDSDDGSTQGSGDDNDGGDTGDGSEGTLTATLAPSDALRAGQALVVTFSEPVEKSSLVVSGAFAGQASETWRSDTELVLQPEGWWDAGEIRLELSIDSADGDALDVSERLRSTSPYSNFQAADRVIGQSDFQGTEPRQNVDAATADANTLDMPEGNVAYLPSEDILYIADTGDSRVLGFLGIPETNNANADFVIGQPDFTSSHGETSQDHYRSPQGVSVNGGRLIVGDKNSNRLLIYDGYPQGQTSASYVVGQQNFTDHDDSCQTWNLNHSHGQYVTPGGRLIVADGVNHRVLVFNEIPEENGATADLVLGQSNLSQCAPNDSNRNGVPDEGELPAADTFQHPSSVWSDDERLVVVDNYNNRVLIWNSFPTSNGEPADIVLGQGAMNMNAANDNNQDGEPDAEATARVLAYPFGAWVEGERVFVADQHNNRVLVWNSWPEHSFQPADAVLGQADFSGVLPNAGGNADARTFNNPKAVRVINGELFVTDWQNSRVLIFNDE